MDARVNICIVIPTYRNAGMVADVAMRAFRQIEGLEGTRIIVVNDGSPDNTGEILASLPVTVVSLPENRGKGGALKAGFTKARELGYDYAITLDSDGQHFPEDMPLFFEAIMCNPGALILGSRDLRAQNMPGKNTFANKFSNFWFRVQTAQVIPDTQTGFRAYPLANLPRLGLLTSRYEAELEMLVLCAWRGVRLVPVPVRVHYPPREERVTSFRPFWDFFRISVLNTILCVLALVYGYPRMLIHKICGR